MDELLFDERKSWSDYSERLGIVDPKIEGPTDKDTIRNLVAHILLVEVTFDAALKTLRVAGADLDESPISKSMDGVFDYCMYALGMPPDNHSEIVASFPCEMEQTAEVQECDEMFCWDWLYDKNPAYDFVVKNPTIEDMFKFISGVEDDIAESVARNPYAKAWYERGEAQ